jgi:uncharacterized protein (DUF302 family)
MIEEIESAQHVRHHVGGDRGFAAVFVIVFESGIDNTLRDGSAAVTTEPPWGVEHGGGFLDARIDRQAAVEAGVGTFSLCRRVDRGFGRIYGQGACLGICGISVCAASAAWFRGGGLVCKITRIDDTPALLRLRLATQITREKGESTMMTRYMRPIGLLLALFLASFVTVAADNDAAMPPGLNMLVEVESPLGFEATLERIEANAKELGWKVPKKWKVNFRKNMMKITDTDIGPNQVLKMCEPFAAVKLLAQDRYKQLTAMMPCTIAVYEKSNGKTYISMMNLDVMGQMYGGDVKVMAEELAPQMAQMLDFD